MGELGDSGLSVTFGPHGEVVVEGDVDAFSAPVLDQGVSEAADGVGDVVVDLARVDFMDSAGLNVFVRHYKPLHADGRRLVVRNASRPVRRAMEICGMATFVDLEG